MNTKPIIPAGAGEIMQYIVHAFNDNTIRFVLHYPGGIEADVLKKAVLALAASVDVLHAAFIPGRKKAHWQVNAVSPEHCFRCVDNVENVTAAALEQALQPIAPSDPAQLRCVLVRGQRDSAVVLLISHLCADGTDGKYLLKKLCEAYHLQLQYGNCAQLHIKNGSRDVRQVYARLNKKEKRRLFIDPRTGVKSVFVYPADEAGKPYVAERHISAQVMMQARAKARRTGATVNDLLLAACYHAYADTMSTAAHTPVSVMSMMDLRRHCVNGDSQGLSNLTGSMATVLPDGICHDFSQTLAAIVLQTKKMKEDPLAGLYGMPLLHGAANHFPLQLLLAVSSRIYGSLAVGLTNIGSFEAQDLHMGNIIPDQGWFGGPVKRKPGLQISCASFNGSCTLCIWGYAAEADKPVLQKVLNRMAGQIEDYAACD